MFTKPDWKNHTSYPGGDVFVGKGTVIREYVIINKPASTDLTKIGTNCYIMNSCFVGHDCLIGNDVTLCPHACLAGDVFVGDFTTIGMNASIHQGSRIGRCCMIGAGSFFKGETPCGVTWAGVPARPIKVNVIGIERSNLSDVEKDKIISNAQLFIDNFKSSSNIQTTDWISTTVHKTCDVILNCVRWFNIPNVFNKKFTLRIPPYRII
jgi:acyl-[acyl carrier protein]--UDP-N-acetylglucosamine O-acyltransferase